MGMEVGRTGRTVGLAGAAADGGRDPSVHQLRLFLVLAEELHFGRAARRMFVSQPSFSRQIIALEQRLGVGLVVRTSRRVELTLAGQALLPHVRMVVQTVDALQSVAETQQRALAGHLVIGSFEAQAGIPSVRRMLEEFRQRHPDTVVELRTVNFVSQTRALLEEEVDAVFCYLPVPRGIQAQVLGREPRVLCLSEHHPLALRSSVDVEELAEQPMIGLSDQVAPVWRDSWTTDLWPNGCRAPRTRHRAEDFETVLSTVVLGEGVCIVPAAARQLYPRPGIAYVDIAGIPACTSALAWSATRRDTQAVTALRLTARVLADTSGAEPTGPAG